MSFRARVTVLYPVRHGQMTLRTEDDWDTAVYPVEREGHRFEFELPSARDVLAFKPVLDFGDHLDWAEGNNYLVYPCAGQHKVVYPFFRGSPDHGRITRLHTVEADGRSWRMRFYLPPGYGENPLKRYPVLYMHDGTNLFFPHEAFMGREWQVDETMDLLNGLSVIDRVIVVGLHASDRMRDYTAPGFYAYGKALVEHIKPFVDRNLASLTGPESTGVMGSSLGGVVSLHLAWQHPEVFGSAACLSSTFGYRDDLFERVTTQPKRPIRLYLDSGWPRDNFERTRHMRDVLLLHGFDYGHDLLHFTFPHAQHNELHWADRIHVPFQFMFGKRAGGRPS